MRNTFDIIWADACFKLHYEIIEMIKKAPDTETARNGLCAKAWPAAEVEAFNESTKDYGMTMREHLALTSKLGKQPPWEMTPANRMKYAKWLGTKRGLKARGVAA